MPDLTTPFKLVSKLASMRPIYDSTCPFCHLPQNYNAQMGEIFTDHRRDCVWAEAQEFMKWIRSLA